MIIRLITGAGLLLLGYYIGREIKRAEPIRKELQEAREQDKKKATALKQSTKKEPENN